MPAPWWRKFSGKTWTNQNMGKLYDEDVSQYLPRSTETYNPNNPYPAAVPKNNGSFNVGWMPHAMNLYRDDYLQYIPGLSDMYNRDGMKKNLAPPNTYVGEDGRVYEYTDDTGGDEVKPKPLKWVNKYNVQGAPTWWKGVAPTKWNAETKYIATMNALIPFLSPEDQRTVGMNLSQIKGFKDYNALNANFATPPSELNDNQRRWMMSQGRAKAALETLGKIAKFAGGANKLGPGYKFLQNVMGTMQDFGSQGNNMQTRRQRMNMLSAIDPLRNQAKEGSLSPYGQVVNMLTNPYYTAGQVVPTSKGRDGNYIFGKYNPNLGG
jgi:hypothetical protein